MVFPAQSFLLSIDNGWKTILLLWGNVWNNIYVLLTPAEGPQQGDLLIIHLLFGISAYVSVFFVVVECKQLILAETIKAIFWIFWFTSTLVDLGNIWWSVFRGTKFWPEIDVEDLTLANYLGNLCQVFWSDSSIVY